MLHRKILICILIFFFSYGYVLAQQFNFSLLNFTEQRVNPAYVANGDYWVFSSVHREQQTGPDFNIASTTASFQYPHFMPNSPNIKGGFGINFLNDQSGSTNTFEVQEVGLSYALQFLSNSGENLSFGLSAFNQRRGFSFDQYLTNTQFIPDRGFSAALNNGENFQEVSTNFYRYNAGLIYSRKNSLGQTQAHFGISVFDINRPDNTFFNDDSRILPTYISELSFSIYSDPKLNLIPQILWVYQANRSRLNLGLTVDYRINEKGKLRFGMRYLVGREVIGNFEFVKDNFSFGAAYDLSTGNRTSANNGAFEFGIKLRGLVKSKKKNKKRSKRGQTSKRSVPERPVLRPIVVPISVKPYQPQAKPEFVSKLLLDENLPSRGSAKVEQYYTYNYGLNQYTAKPEFKDEFKAIVSKLMANSDYYILIEGHTDNSGGDELNDILSMTRAQQIADYLIQIGVDPSKINVEGRGKSMPISNNDSAMGRAMNRRVEITLYR